MSFRRGENGNGVVTNNFKSRISGKEIILTQKAKSMDYELENVFSDIEEDENDAPLDVVQMMTDQALRQWLPVSFSSGECNLPCGRI